MVHIHLRWRTPRAASAIRSTSLIVGLYTAALTAQAQPASRGAKPDPLDPKAGVPTLTYESSLSQYRRLGNEAPISWREANDTVARIGGWRVYAREAQQPTATPAPRPSGATPDVKPAPEPSAVQPSETAKPMPPGHGGHKMP